MWAENVLSAPCIKLNDGNSIPAVGLGTFQGNYSYTSSFETVVNSVKSAVDIGYRHLDTAWVYDTEEGVGRGIGDKIEEGVIKREDVFVTTKLWVTCMRRELVVPALKKSLSKLGLDYVNMFLIHWPVAVKPGDAVYQKDEDGNILFEDDLDFNETWKAMEECKKLGLTKSIGVSNFNVNQLKELVSKCTIKPANIQIEGHVHLQQTELEELCQKHGIIISCFSPLGKPSRSWKKEKDPDLFTDPIVTKIGKKYNKSNAQIGLKFLVQRGHAVCPKSNTPERQRANLDIFDFELTGEEMSELKSCNESFRVLWLEPLKVAKNYPFK